MLSFRKGDLVYIDEPYVTAVADEHLKDTCNWCFKFYIPANIRCRDCLEVIYCSPRCKVSFPTIFHPEYTSR